MRDPDARPLRSSLRAAIAARLATPIGRNTLLLMTANYLQTGVGLMTHVFLANQLGPASYGSVSYCLVIGGIAMTIVQFGNDRTLVRDLVQTNDRNAVFSASLVQRSIVAVVVLALGLLLAAHHVVDGSLQSAGIVAGVVWGATMGLMPTAWLDSRYQMGISAAVMLCERVLFGVLAVLLLTLQWSDASAVAAMSCLIAARVIGFGAQWFLVLRTYRPAFRAGWSRIVVLFRENVFVFGAAVCGLMLTHANQLFLERRSGPAVLANYAVALQLISLVTIAQAQLARLFSPAVSELTRPGTASIRLRIGLFRHAGVSALVTIGLAVPLLLLAPWGLDLLFRGQYPGAVDPARILGIWVIFYGPAMIVSQYLVCLRMTRAYLLITSLAGVLGLSLGQILVPRLGASGVACALLFSHLPAMAVQVILVLRRTRGAFV